MAPIEDQKSSASLSNSSAFEVQEKKIQEKQNNVQTPNNHKLVSIESTEADIQIILQTKKCDGEKIETTLIGCDKKDTNFNTSNINCTQSTADPNMSASVSQDHLKTNETENESNAIHRGEINMKRTRRSFIAQETDVYLEENSLRCKRKKKNTTDQFCWRCHKESVEAHCSACPRSWHRKCVGMQQSQIQNWICGECAAILRAENAETRSSAMAQLSIDQLCLLLKHVVEKMREYPGSEPFSKPVELSEAPNYLDYVVKPMDLTLLESNVRAKLYGSTDAFMADAKWIQHNCIVFNTCGGVYADTSKLTNAVKKIIKLARQEVSEIEACPDCYAHGRNLLRPQPAWFIEPCRRPHPLVWAKLKGFPFWPAKAMPRINTQGFVDVRFFGEHDRAWVSPRDLYLYSEDPPVPLPRKRKLDMEECVREITRHCRKLELAFGQFKFAPPKVQYNPHDPMQIKLMLPNYDPLCSNNSMTSQLLNAKRTTPLKRRLNVKTKSQNDSERTDNSDVENKTLNNVNESTKPSNIDDNSSKETKEDEDHRIVKSTTVTDIVLYEAEAKSSGEGTHSQKNTLTNLESVIKDDIQPSTSKTDIDDINKENSNVVKYEVNMSSITKLEKKQSKIMSDSIFLEKSSNEEDKLCFKKQQETDLQESKKDFPVKTIVNKGNTIQTSANPQRKDLKGSKTIQKVYKPKTRIVDKMNAEKALRSVAATWNESSNVIESTSTVKEKSIKNNCKSNQNLANVTNAQTEMDDDHKGGTDIDNREVTGQPIVLLLNKPPEKGKGCDISPLQQNIKTSPQALYQPKEYKARKSFSNKSRNCPQLIPRSSTNIVPKSNSSMDYVVLHPTENAAEYQMLPPEAGPFSARLFHGAQDLARKIAKLMEEAYKEAAHDNQNCENGTVSDNHQATVHFLRLQIERMRWQHQQQLAELRHNTDRILREMKASLEAERLRAVEETRREAEDEKLRCIEEIKRKQWCAMCGREALFYCCWNTAYCDYPCQQSHWPMHMKTCAQKPSFITIVTSSTASSNQQQVMPRLMLNTQNVTSNIQRA